MRTAPRAIFFDVDFTLIYPGPTFQAEGYARFCGRYGIAIDAGRFGEAVAGASEILDAEQDHVYATEIFVRYTRRVLEGMGGRGERLNDCAREIYDEWAANQHFFLYDDVEPALSALAARGVKLGLISYSHRCLESFQEHFALTGLMCAAVSSSEHGFMKPHPSIFEAALAQANVAAEESLMVGDSLTHDIEGARRVGMRGVLVHRSDTPAPRVEDVPVIGGLDELLPLIWFHPGGQPRLRPASR
jgi:putative hydrolase of the HAD superfamily